ncbi:hypothetical protein FF021_21590, partial [Leptospira noguchii]
YGSRWKLSTTLSYGSRCGWELVSRKDCRNSDRFISRTKCLLGWLCKNRHNYKPLVFFVILT